MGTKRPGAVLLWGDDPFLLREEALELLAGVQPVEVDAREWQGGETADLATPSLFEEPRALLITEARALPERAISEIAAYLTAPAPDSTLILSVLIAERGKPPAGLVKLIEKKGEVRQVSVARKDLPAWLAVRAKAKGLRIDPRATAALVEILGEDAAELDQALDQLATAFEGAQVTVQLVGSQFRGLGEQRVWDLCDKAFGKDLPGSVRSLWSLLASREDPLMILGGVASRARDLLRVRGLPERMPLSDVAREAGLRFDWQARRYREQAGRFTIDELVGIHSRIVDADRELKSGADGEVVLPLLVTAIAG